MRLILALSLATCLLGAACELTNPMPARPAMNVTIGAGGTIEWEGQRIAYDELERRVAEAGQQKPRPLINIRIDDLADPPDELQQEMLFRVVDVVSRHGVGKTGIMLHPQR